jgi:hypothetical protein
MGIKIPLPRSGGWIVTKKKPPPTPPRGRAREKEVKGNKKLE